MEKRRPRGIAGDKTICLPIDEGIDYERLVENEREYRSYLDKKIDKYPELFPKEIKEGFRLHGFVTSKRQQIRTRRILLKANHEAYQIRPDFVTPYMSEKAELAEKALYLRKHGVSYEGIANILGRSEMHCYSLCQSLGRMSIRRNNGQRNDPSPPHLVADEKHTKRGKEKEFIAVTAASGCTLGASCSRSMDTSGFFTRTFDAKVTPDSRKVPFIPEGFQFS